MVEKLYSYKLDFWKLTVALNNCPSRHPVLVFLVVWFSRGSRGLVTWWAKGDGSHLNRQACHLPSCPSALTAPDQAPPVDRQHISMYHCLARRLLSSSASLSTFIGGKEVLIAANHRRFASTGSVRDYFFSVFVPKKSSTAELTLPLLQSRNHAWPGSQAWGCRPKLLHRWTNLWL